MSAFTRKNASPTISAGTRPGLHGQTLISTGLADLDRLLGGGTPLSGLVLVLEDAASGHAAAIARLFVAEGVACGQRVLWGLPELPAGGPGKVLPREAKPGSSEASAKEDKEPAEQQLRIAWQYRRYIKARQEEAQAAEAAVEAQRQQEKAAHRRASGAAASSSSSAAAGPPKWCHHFDSLRTIGNEALAGTHLECRAFGDEATPAALGDAAAALICATASTPPTQPTTSPAAPTTPRHTTPPAPPTTTPAEPPRPTPLVPPAPSPAFQPRFPPAMRHPHPRLLARPPAQAPQLGPETVGRIVLQSLGAPECGWGAGPAAQQELLRLVYRLRGLVRDTRCAVLLTVPAGIFGSSFETRLQHLCDTVLALETVRDDSDVVRLVTDPTSCAGLLHVRKLQPLNALAGPAIQSSLYVLRVRRRRLSIEPIQIDPDAEAAEAEAAAEMGRKSAVSALCGGPPKADNGLDF